MVYYVYRTRLFLQKGVIMPTMLRMDTKLRKGMLEKARKVALVRTIIHGYEVTWQQVVTHWMNLGMKHANQNTTQKEMSS